MRRALIGTALGWFAGAATLMAQMPSPYPTYPSSMGHVQHTDASMPVTPYLGASGPSAPAMPPQGYAPMQPPGYAPMMPSGPVMNGMPMSMQGQMIGPDGSMMMVPVNGQGQMILPNPPMGQGPMNLPAPGNQGGVVMPGQMANQMQPMNQAPMVNPNAMMNQGAAVNQGPIMGQYPGAGPGEYGGPCPAPCPNGMVGPCPNACMPGCAVGCANGCGNGVCGPVAPWAQMGAPCMDNGFGGFSGGAAFANGMPFGNGGPCQNGGCPNGCCQDGKMWASAEVLYWWARGQNIPALVTSGISAAQPGILGQPGTAVLFGAGLVDEGGRWGGRWTLGCWFDECSTMGIEGSFFYLGQMEQDFVLFGSVGQVIGRPFFNTNPAVNAMDAEQVNVPGILAGSISVQTCTQVYGAELNLRRNLSCVCNCCYSSRIDLIGGFRYMHLDDCVDIQEDLTNLDPARGAVGEGFLVDDSFMATNNFYGGQLGLAGSNRWARWYCDWRTVLALGATEKKITIAGSTTFLDPVPGGNPVTQPGGLLAQPSNIGTYTFSDFSIVPEVNVNFGYQFTPLIRGWVGYSFIYWSNVARSGDQIDFNVDARQLPTRAGPGTGTTPAFALHNNDFWTMGVSLGLQFRY